MGLVGQIGISQLIKQGEELCGDAVEVVRNEDNCVVVLSDGLGSGVKANILSNMTIQIAAKMVSNNIEVEDVVETIVQTLPTCKVRKLAYSTFSILKIYESGWAQLVEYDGCPVLKISKGNIEQLETQKRMLSGRTIHEACFKLEENDLLVIVSDGVTQAGLGCILPLGLGIDGLIRSIKEYVNVNSNAQEIANQITDLCKMYYADSPGDDTTAVVVRVKYPKRGIVMTGPPKDPNLDKIMVKRLMAEGDIKIVCGGTTANIVCRETGKEMEVNFDSVNFDIPPIARIKGIDLVTEGILTLSKGLEILERMPMRCQSEDGANLLVAKLLDCDIITFMVGTQINPAYQNPDLPIAITLRKAIIEKWEQKLIEMGKLVTVEMY